MEILPRDRSLTSNEGILQIGTYIAYSAAPGTSAHDSEGMTVFGSVLNDLIRSDEDLDLMFRSVRREVYKKTIEEYGDDYQTPWSSNVLMGAPVNICRDHGGVTLPLRQPPTAAGG